MEDKEIQPMEVMTQNYLDIDFCDNCGAPIREGETVHLDVAHEHAGIIPAYCPKCASMEAKE